MQRSDYKRRKNAFYFFVGFLFLLSLSIMLMPLSEEHKAESPLFMIGTGVLFWAGIAGTVFTALRINKMRKLDRVFLTTVHTKPILGLTHFFQNKAASIADILMLCSLAALVISAIFGLNHFILFLCIALLVFLFGMHCMLNGINYIFINYRVRRGEENEKE